MVFRRRLHLLRLKVGPSRSRERQHIPPVLPLILWPLLLHLPHLLPPQIHFAAYIVQFTVFCIKEVDLLLRHFRMYFRLRKWVLW